MSICLRISMTQNMNLLLCIMSEWLSQCENGDMLARIFLLCTGVYCVYLVLNAKKQPHLKFNQKTAMCSKAQGKSIVLDLHIKRRHICV